MKSKNTAHYFLKGGGEMGELIRNKDWAKTPMGDPDVWPQSLRTMVSVMLENPFGMYIAWGKEYTQIYNDGYRPILGATKHPQALGISSKETFSEIWHIIESMFDGVMNGIPVGFPDFKLELDRNGFMETCYFDFAYSPIRMNNGEVGGVLVTVIETTNKKNAEIELKESKNELHFAIEAAQLGTFDYNPLTNKFSANDRLKKWFGLSPNDHIDLTDAIEAVVEVDRAKLKTAIQNALDFSSGGNYDVEYTIINPVTKKEIIIHAKGRAWFNEKEIAYRLNGTLEDVTEQVKTRQKIAQSESNLKLMILQAPVAISIFRGSTYKVEIANKHALELWGRTEEEVLGKSIFSSMPELETQGIRELLDGVVETGIRFSTSELEVQLVRNGVIETVYVNFSYEPLFNEEGTINGIMAIGFDVTPQVLARKELEDSEKRYNLMLMQSPFAFLILKGEDMVVHLANESMKEVLGKGPDIEGKPLLEVLPEIKGQAFPDLLQGVYSTGIPYSANEMLAKLTRNGKLEDLYFNYVYQPYYEADNTISGVTVIAYDVTFTVLANKQIELSEKRFRNLITQAVHPILIFKGEDLILEIANEPLFDLWNVDKDVLGKPFLEILPELKAQQIEGLLLDVLKNGVTHVGNEQPVYFNPPNGEPYTSYFNFVYLPLKENDDTISGVIVQAYDVTEQVVARQKIEESEQSIRTLVENAPFPIAVYTGKEMRVTLANQSIMEVWGKGINVIGKLYTDILPELEGQHIFEQVREVLITGIPFHAKNQKVDLLINGKLKSHYFNYSFTPLYDASGNVYAVMNTAAEVTELHEAKQTVEAALTEIKLFKFMADTAGDPFILMNEDGRFVYLNEMAIQKWGYTKQELKKLSVPDVDPIYNAEKFREMFQLSQEKSIPPFETLHKSKKGKVYPVEISIGSIHRDGKPLLFAIARDISERKKAEEDVISAFRKIEENEERLNIVINASELGIWEYNLKTKKNIVSQRCNEIFGVVEENNIEDVEPASHFHPDDQNLREKAIEESFRTGILHYEGRIIWPDKTIHWVESRGKVFYNSQNKPERVIGTMRDITEEKNFQNLLLEREQKFRLLADSMAQHVWTSDLHGKINYFNKSVFEYSGLTLEQLNEDGWLQIVHPEDRDINIKKWNHSIKTGEDFLLEHRFRKYNGEYRWQLSRAQPQKDKNGNITMWVGTSTDIQDQKMFTNELEKQVFERTRELNQNNLDLEKMNKELQAFAYISSHDLQEPLRKIQTFASQIIDKEYQNLTESGKDKFERMQRAANRMQHLIQDLLAYSRTSTEEINFEFAHLKNIIELVKEDLKEELQQKNATVETGKMCEVKVIPFQFRQLIYNLVSNSLKFTMQERTPHIKIKSEIAKGSKFDVEGLSKEIEYCHISISDNGIGFDQEYNEKIFEVFSRLHGKEKYQGTGIGLAIVKKIVENHNGFIFAKGELNIGATFDIYIPSS